MEKVKFVLVVMLVVILCPVCWAIQTHNFNNWRMQKPADLMPQQRLELLAKRDVVGIVEHYAQYDGIKNLLPKDLKVINPRIKVYRIYDLTCKNSWDNDPIIMQTPIERTVIDANDWWLRDAAGNPIAESGTSGNTLFLDCGKPGFKEYMLEAILSRTNCKGFDGLLFDYTISDMYRVTKGTCANYTSDDDYFERAYKPFINYLFAGLKSAGYRIITNGGGGIGTTKDFPKWRWTHDQSDGVIDEQGAVNFDGSWITSKYVIQGRMETYLKDPLEVWCANNGIKPHVPEYKEKIILSMAMYYAGLSTTAPRYYTYCGDGGVAWDPLFDFDIGKPQFAAVQKSAGGAKLLSWSRTYTKGFVVFNYETEKSVECNLSKMYVDSDGNYYKGKIVIPPHRGLVLRRL